MKNDVQKNSEEKFIKFLELPSLTSSINSKDLLDVRLEIGHMLGN